MTKREIAKQMEELRWYENKRMFDSYDDIMDDLWKQYHEAED